MYLKDQTDETGQAIKCHYESCGERWQVAVAPSSDGFQQMSFVNSIATTKGKFLLHIYFNCLGFILDFTSTQTDNGFYCI